VADVQVFPMGVLGSFPWEEMLSAGYISRMFYVNHRKICDGDGEREKPVCD